MHRVNAKCLLRNEGCGRQRHGEDTTRRTVTDETTTAVCGLACVAYLTGFCSSRFPIYIFRHRATPLYV